MLSYIERINNLIRAFNPELKTAFEQITKIRTYAKGEFLLKQGQICRKSFLLITGVAHKYYQYEGKIISTELYFKDDLALAFHSYTLQEPSKETIKAITEVVVSELAYDDFQILKLKYPAVVVLDLMITEYYAVWLENRLFQFYTQTARSRYLQILEKSPHILQYIPLTILAAYLGISLETLSRIRAKT